MSDSSTNNSRRFNGILTKNDQEFLQTIEWDEQSSLDRDTRHRIRQRIIQAMVDLHFLTRYLHDKDRKLIFKELASNPDLIVGSVAFLYLGTRDFVEELNHEDDAIDTFAEFIHQGIVMGDQRRGWISQPDVSIEHQQEEPEPEKIRNQLLDGNGTAAQLNYLIRAGEDQPLLESIIESGETMTVEDQHNVIEVTPKMAESILENQKQ